MNGTREKKKVSHQQDVLPPLVMSPVCPDLLQNVCVLVHGVDHLTLKSQQCATGIKGHQIGDNMDVWVVHAPEHQELLQHVGEASREDQQRDVFVPQILQELGTSLSVQSGAIKITKRTKKKTTKKQTKETKRTKETKKWKRSQIIGRKKGLRNDATSNQTLTSRRC